MKKYILILAMVGLLALTGIVLATSTMNPRITYTGYGIPDPSVGRVGDIYIDLDTNILYVLGTDGWGVFAVLPTTVNGTDGLDGATWIVGDTEPASETGKNGDLYFNYATLDVYRKTNDVWTYLVNLQGPAGPQGPQGETGPAGQDGINGTNGIDGSNGSIWYNELVANLTDDLGYDGDYYMFTNGTVYYKINGTWVYFTSLMGPAGPQGETGETGPQGPVGADGINGTNGIDGQEGATGETGPQGPVGADGINGTNGIDGQDGATGVAGSQGSAGADTSVQWWLYLVAAGCVGACGYSVYKSRKKNGDNKENA